MDQEWHLSLDQLAGHAELLAKIWPADVLAEIFAEAARVQSAARAEPRTKLLGG